MPDTFSDTVDRLFRDHVGYTGDGQGGSGDLPVGDRSTARKPIEKRDIREVFKGYQFVVDLVNEAEETAQSLIDARPTRDLFVTWDAMQVGDPALGLVIDVGKVAFKWTGTTTQVFDDLRAGWEPQHRYTASPFHWSDTPAHAACLACGKFLGYGEIGAYRGADEFAIFPEVRGAGYRRFDLCGEVIELEKPLIIGDIDVTQNGTMDNVGTGIMLNTEFANGRFKARADFDTTPIATFDHATEGTVVTVPAALLIIGTYDNRDRFAGFKNQFHVGDITLARSLDIDGSFVANGVFLINSNRTTVECKNVYNYGPDGFGLSTSVGDKIENPNRLGHFNARNVLTKNPELRVIGVTFSGRYRAANDPYPVDQDTQNATGMQIFTGDYWLEACVFTAVKTSYVIDCCFNGTVVDMHAWSNKSILGPDAVQVTESSNYGDFTDKIYYGFKHNLSNMSFLSNECDMVLIATKPGETGEAMVLAGAQFANTNTIRYEVDTTLDPNASWADPDFREITLSGIYAAGDSVDLFTIPRVVRVTAEKIWRFLHDKIQLAPTVAGNFFTIESTRGLKLMADYDDNNATGLGSHVTLGTQGLDIVTVKPNSVQVDKPILGEGVGYFGMGTGAAPQVLNLDTHTISGHFWGNGGGDVAPALGDNPFPADNNVFSLIVVATDFGADDTFMSQTATKIVNSGSTPETKTRTKAGTSWSAWV